MNTTMIIIKKKDPYNLKDEVVGNEFITPNDGLVEDVEDDNMSISTTESYYDDLINRVTNFIEDINDGNTLNIEIQKQLVRDIDDTFHGIDEDLNSQFMTARRTNIQRIRNQERDTLDNERRVRQRTHSAKSKHRLDTIKTKRPHLKSSKKSIYKRKSKSLKLKSKRPHLKSLKSKRRKRKSRSRK